MATWSWTAAFPGGSSTRINIGGDATVRLAEPLDLTIQATVGGDIHGAQLVSSGSGVFKVVYGEGTARLDLIVGGDLHLGGSAPRSSSSAWGWWDEGGDFNREMHKLQEEIRRIGQEISQTAQDMGREISKAYSGGTRQAQQEAERNRQRAEERIREAEGRMREAEDVCAMPSSAAVATRMARAGCMCASTTANGASTPTGWSGSSSRRATPRVPASPGRWRPSSGRWRASACRQRRPCRRRPALRHSRRRHPRQALRRCTRRRPPVPPPAATGATIRIDIEPTDPPAPIEDVPAQADAQAAQAEASAAPPPNIETERAAILQMVAEGRISPEEGDMLLDALG